MYYRSYAKIKTIWKQGKIAYDSTLIASLLSDLQNKCFCLGGLCTSPFIMGQTTQDLPSQAKTLSFAKFSSLVLIGPVVNKIIISI